MQMRLNYAHLRGKIAATLLILGKHLAHIKQSRLYKSLKTNTHEYTFVSLANRILVLQFAWALIVYLLVIAALWFSTNLVIESSVRHQGEGWISKLDELGIPIYASDDSAQLTEAISYVRNFPEVLRAQYLDVSGKKIIAEYTRKNIVLATFPG